MRSFVKKSCRLAFYIRLGEYVATLSFSTIDSFVYKAKVENRFIKREEEKRRDKERETKIDRDGE